MPHRERRRLDQAGQCVEGRGEAPDLVAKRRRLAFAVGRVGEPEQDRPLLERRRRRRSAHLQHARRAQRPHRHGKAAAGRGGALGKLGKRRPLLGREAATAAAQIGDAGRRSIETEQAGKAAVGLQPAAAAEQGRDGDMGAEQRRRPLGVADPGGRPPAESDAAQGRPGGDGQPRAANQRDQRHDGGGEGQHRHLLGRVRGQRNVPAPSGSAPQSCVCPTKPALVPSPRAAGPRPAHFHQRDAGLVEIKRTDFLAAVPSVRRRTATKTSQGLLITYECCRFAVRPSF